MKIVYTAHASATGGRDGRATTSDGKVDVALSAPKEMGGSGEGTNPEQLFASGYAACFLGALRFVAGKERITVPSDATVAAAVGIGPRDDGTGFGLDVALTITAPGLEPAVLNDLVQKAHVVCPYSHATRGNIEVALATA